MASKVAFGAAMWAAIAVLADQFLGFFSGHQPGGDGKRLLTTRADDWLEESLNTADLPEADEDRRKDQERQEDGLEHGLSFSLICHVLEIVK